jgi:hypothetical protein
LISTATALTSSASSVVVDSPVTFTATVTAASGAVPTGSVTFFNGSASIGTILLSNGIATFNYPGAAASGPIAITALYNGSAIDAPSTSPAFSQSIAGIPTTTTLPSETLVHGATYTFTATVTAQSGPTPTGTVTFYIGSATAGAGTAIGTQTLSNGVATLDYTLPSSGDVRISAVYSGSSTDASSVSNVLPATGNGLCCAKY